MSKKKKDNMGSYKVNTADWNIIVAVNEEVFDDPYVEACTQALEIKMGLLNDVHKDLLVNPVMVCTKVLKSKKNTPSRYINTYKILQNAGSPKKAEILRNIFLKSVQVDLAKEPLSASYTNE